MELKKIDPKIFTNTVAFALAVSVVVAIVGWAWFGFEYAQTLKDPVQEVIGKEGLL